jgi:hypothetical protein
VKEHWRYPPREDQDPHNAFIITNEISSRVGVEPMRSTVEARMAIINHCFNDALSYFVNNDDPYLSRIGRSVLLNKFNGSLKVKLAIGANGLVEENPNYKLELDKSEKKAILTIPEGFSIFSREDPTTTLSRILGMFSIITDFFDSTNKFTNREVMARKKEVQAHFLRKHADNDALNNKRCMDIVRSHPEGLSSDYRQRGQSALKEMFEKI